MKPKYLEFSGINSFARKAEIDFEKLLSGGIFGIFGDTGSGKTTILDSMIFALYGRIDRIKGGVGNEIINYNCDRAYVRFDFETETPQGARCTAWSGNQAQKLRAVAHSLRGKRRANQTNQRRRQEHEREDTGNRRTFVRGF